MHPPPLKRPALSPSPTNSSTSANRSTTNRDKSGNTQNVYVDGFGLTSPNLKFDGAAVGNSNLNSHSNAFGNLPLGSGSNVVGSNTHLNSPLLDSKGSNSPLNLGSNVVDSQSNSSLGSKLVGSNSNSLLVDSNSNSNLNPHLVTANSNSLLVERPSVELSSTELSSQNTNLGPVDRWQPAIKKCVKAVVSIHFSSVTPFDTERAYVSEATGFVVDAKRGIIMTNRHVVGPGPFYGYAVFDNHEECAVSAIYRDPVHDFGFLRFDPHKIRYMQIEELQLHPDNARVGTEIRVIGNDAGEKLSILAGVISRVDRNAPDYGEMGYNDFNTEYIQAAASATGGSSGSPVVDINGDVVALQAGGSSVASTDFFLPLFRGQRALKCLQSHQPITRGTIQVRWLLRPFDECRRLGLTLKAEQLARQQFPTAIGLLVASTTLPEGPACGLVMEGDCLLSVNGAPISTFRSLDAVLDAQVGETVHLELMRHGATVNIDVKVQNLFDITPRRFVRVAGAVLHELSYQIASYYAQPVRGVYIAYSGFYFQPSPVAEDYTGWVVTELDDQPTPNLDEFIRVVQSIPNQKLVAGKFWHVADPHQIVTSIVNVNRQLANGPQDCELAVCNDLTGKWDFLPLPRGAEPEKLVPQTARCWPAPSPDASPAVRALSRSIVRIKMLRPAVLEGYTIPDAQQHGFVIDAKQGLVLVSRLCVPHYLVDLSVVFADAVILPAKVVFLHPQQGYAVVQYDPQLVNADIAEITLASALENNKLVPGTPLKFVGYDLKGSSYLVDTKVADVSVGNIPTGFGVAPRYRTTNVETVGVDSTIIPDLDSGLLADPQSGVVRAVWMCHLADTNATTRRDRMFKFAIDATTLSRTVELIKQAPLRAEIRFLDMEATSIQLAAARIRKVPEQWIEAMEASALANKSSQQRPELLSITRVASSLREYVREGDILVAIDGVLATSVTQLTNRLNREHALTLTIIRNGRELAIEVPTKPSSETVTRTLVSWCGMAVHAPHHAVLQQVKQPPSQVYINATHPGSPAAMYEIYGTSFVTHINGIATPDVDTFHRVVSEVPNDAYAKIRVVNFEGVPTASSIRTCYHYFPTWRLNLSENGVWEHHE